MKFIHGSSGILVIAFTSAAMWAGIGVASAAAPVRWTEAKAEARINAGTYRVVNKAEVFHYENVLRGPRQLVGLMEEWCRTGSPQCPNAATQEKIRAILATGEAKLAQAKAGHPLKGADCKGTLGLPKLRLYKKFRCETTIVDDAASVRTKVYRTMKNYTLHLEVAPKTRRGFIVRGVVLHA